jgi:hypothetical protein
MDFSNSPESSGGFPVDRPVVEQFRQAERTLLVITPAGLLYQSGWNSPRLRLYLVGLALLFLWIFAANEGILSGTQLIDSEHQVVESDIC